MVEIIKEYILLLFNVIKGILSWEVDFTDTIRISIGELGFVFITLLIMIFLVIDAINKKE